MSVAAQAAHRRAPVPVSAVARRLRSQLVTEILPFWLEKGWDKRRGGFHERFFFDRTPDTLVVRATLTQFRQINALALAAELGWRDGLRQAFQGLEYMLEHAWGPDGKPGIAHILAPDGAATDLRRDPSDHAAAIIAMTTLAKVSNDAQVASLLRLVISYVETAFHDQEGRLKPDEAGDHAVRRVEGYIELMVAMLWAHGQLGTPKALERATRYRRFLETMLVDADTGMMPEFLDVRFGPLMDGESFLVSPGRMAQAASAIRRFEQLSGLSPSPLATHLLGAALRACAPATGFLLESIDSHGTVHDSHTRLGAQCSLARAWLTQAENGIDGAREAGEAMIEAIADRFLVPPFPGGWIDRLDSQGKPAIDTVPAASLNAIVALAVAANPAG